MWVKAFDNIVSNKRKLPKQNRVIYYTAKDFEEKYKAGEISDDTYRNRYSQVKGYYVSNQWGIGNWGEAEELLRKSGFVLIAE